MALSIRDERPEDAAAVRNVNVRAFGRAAEADLVERLRANGAITLSLVAVERDRVVGHILFSPVALGDGASEVIGAGLGPMAVLPEFQRGGVGSMLVLEGIGRLRSLGCPYLVVLGHPEYYPRFGFVTASSRHVRCEWDVPDAAFMLLAIDPDRMQGAAGLVRYRDEFSAVA